MNCSKSLENHLKSIGVTLNYMNYFKDNVSWYFFKNFEHIFFTIYKDESFETSKL